LITFWILLLLAVVLAGIARWKQVYPHAGMMGLLAVPALASLALVAVPDAFWWLVAIDGVVLLLALADLATLPARNALAAERKLGTIASIGKPQHVVLTVIHRGRRARTITVRDGVPSPLGADRDRFALALAARCRSSVTYQLLPRRRGAFVLALVFIQAPSRLGLWKRLFSLPVESRVNVYPDMQQLSEYALLARTNRLSLMGVRRTRRAGGDNEFERLREYQRDDHYKHIDWRASARRNKLTVRQFRTNQSQRIIFLIDCGRMMTGQASGLSLLDHALNAMLMLSFVALRQGDQVGLVCFSDRIHTYVPPRGGMTQTNNLLHACFDRFPAMVESRYDRAFVHLAARCRKRALVVLITHVIDQVNAHQIQQHLGNLTGRHLPLGVLLRDRWLFAAAAEPGDDDIFRAAAAAEILGWRQEVLNNLQSRGVLALDVFPEHLAAPLVNRYLDIKARHLL